MSHLNTIQGCMLGGAAGDALGYAVEFYDLPRIMRTFPEGKITSYQLSPENGLALISDDTQMSLFTANGILFGHTRRCMRGIGGDPTGYVWKCYQDWLVTQGYPRSGRENYFSPSWLLHIPELYDRRAPGLTCLSAIQGGIPGSIGKLINNSKGCGGIMRVAPVGLYYETEPRWIARKGAEIAALTHGHPLGYLPAAVLAVIVNQIVFAKIQYPSLKALFCSAVEIVAKEFSDEPLMGALTEIVKDAISFSENCDSDDVNIRRLGEGWVAEETLAIAAYCALRHENDFSQALIASVNHSGDSDSTGAVLGNILGAWIGYDAIEEKWKTNLELKDVILEIAQDLDQRCLISEYGDYQDPAWERKYIDCQWPD